MPGVSVSGFCTPVRKPGLNGTSPSMLSFQPLLVYWSNDCSRRNAATSGVIFTLTSTASFVLSLILPWNGSASRKLWMLIGFLALTDTNTRASGVKWRVTGAVKSFHRWFAVSERLATGISHTKISMPTVTQNVALSVERLMNSGYWTPCRSQARSLWARCRRMISSTAPKRKKTKATLN